MVRKLCLTVVATLMATVSFASQENDTTGYHTVIDELKVPLVETKHVAPTHFQDNWSVGLYGGVISNWGSDCSHAGFFKLMGPAAAITIGKEITPISGFRMQINYTRNTGVTDDQFGIHAVTGEDCSSMNHNRFKWNSYGLNIEYVLNFTNLLCGFRENRFFHFQGIIGLGGSVARNYTNEKFAIAQGIDNSHGQQLHNLDKYHNRQHSLVTLRAGFAGTFMVARNWNLHVEAMENILDNSYDSNPTTENVWDGHLDIMVGVSYRFNNKGGIAPGFYYPRHDMTVYETKKKEIRNIEDLIKQRRQYLEENSMTIDADAQVMYTLIAFDKNETTVDRLQQTNIYTTARVWSRNPLCFIYITNSTGVDNKLFRKRVDAIRDILMERYDVPAASIVVVPNEKDIRPVGDYIEFIVNE